MQHIQSFLTGKEAAQTCIISKPWFAAWLTRPGLCFDEGDFHKKRHGIEFSDFSRRTVQRYKDLNLRVDKIILKFITKGIRCSNDDTILADELIADALKLGANELELKLHSMGYYLPAHVFAARSLTRLRVCEGYISQLSDGRLISSPLKSLSLRYVDGKRGIVENIFQGCPLIENLDLNRCPCLVKVNVSKLVNLVELLVEVSYGDCHTRVEFKDVSIGFVIHKPEFRYLRRLLLISVKLENEFLTEFSSRFPCIEDFTLAGLNGCINVDISSHSLKYLTLYRLGDELKKLQLNVPNISKFTYKESDSCVFRRLAFMFTTISKEWESDVEFGTDYYAVCDTPWLVELRKFMAKLSESKISLTIKVCGGYNIPSIIVLSMTVPCLDIPIVVENLTLCIDPRAKGKQTILIGLLRSFSPNFILDCKPSWDSHDLCLKKLLYKLQTEDEHKQGFPQIRFRHR